MDQTDLAVPKDGEKWKPQEVVVEAGKEGEWDSLSVRRPSVIHEGGELQRWYDGRKDFPPDAPVKAVPKSPTSNRSMRRCDAE